MSRLLTELGVKFLEREESENFSKTVSRKDKDRRLLRVEGLSLSERLRVDPVIDYKEIDSEVVKKEVREFIHTPKFPIMGSRIDHFESYFYRRGLFVYGIDRGVELMIRSGIKDMQIKYSLLALDEKVFQINYEGEKAIVHFRRSNGRSVNVSFNDFIGLRLFPEVEDETGVATLPQIISMDIRFNGKSIIGII